MINGKELTIKYEEYMKKIDTYDENISCCLELGYKFKKNKKTNNYKRSISMYKHKLNIFKYFLYVNRKEITDYFNNHEISERQLRKKIINDINIDVIEKKYYNIRIINLLSNTDVDISQLTKTEGINFSKKISMSSGIETKKNKLLEHNIKFDKDDSTEINIKYRNIIFSPFYLRKKGLTWDDIEKRNLCIYSDIKRQFIERYVLDNYFDFDTFLTQLSKTYILIKNENIIKILGKKIYKFFGKEKIFFEITKFYNSIKNSKRILKIKYTLTKQIVKGYYVGYIDGYIALSSSEAKLIAILLDNNFKINTNKTYNNKQCIKGSFLYDIYLEDYDVYIEYTGMMKDKEYVKQLNRKKEYVKLNDFTVIFSDDVNEILNDIELLSNKKIIRELKSPIIIEG